MVQASAVTAGKGSGPAPLPLGMVTKREHKFQFWTGNAAFRLVSGGQQNVASPPVEAGAAFAVPFNSVSAVPARPASGNLPA